VSEKFRRISLRYNIRTVFKTKYTLGRFLRKMKPDKEKSDISQCVCENPCECDRSNSGETGRPLGVRINEHKNNLGGHFNKYKLASHALEEGHKFDWTHV
jgi:hypothetical protein